jgi:hypothetical protein
MEVSSMFTCHFEPFIGLRLLVHMNRLVDCGTIIDCGFELEYKGAITLFTETGEYSFYYLEPKAMKQLKNGDWKLLGDRPRWAYICQIDSPYVRQLEANRIWHR